MSFSNPESRIPNRSLDDWLEYQQRVHPSAIALGLERAREVWRRLGAPAPAPVVITVGGTNGKGSTVGFLESILGAAGKGVGAYTSPHLMRYNERVRVMGHDVDDATLIAAFERIEAARLIGPGEPVPLTYFEFATLAALLVFDTAQLDVAVLEVGLGGRLDAVNIIDADAAIVTTVDLDHQEWLGHDRDSIGREKAGIFRPDRPAIIGERAPAQSMLEYAHRIGAELHVAGRDFHAARKLDGWTWSGWSQGDGDDAPELLLPKPGLDAPCQIDNAAAAIAALRALRDRLGWNPHAIAEGVATAHAAARMQRFAGEPELIIDVAHNPQAARMLAQWLRLMPSRGRTIAVFGALGDKDVSGVVAALRDEIDGWVLAGLDRDSPRGLTPDILRARVETALPPVTLQATCESVRAALGAAYSTPHPGDRIVAFGSFFVAAAALRFASERGFPSAQSSRSGASRMLNPKITRQRRV